MSSAVAELSHALKIADPKPSHCIFCYAGSDVDTRFVDFDAAVDRGVIIEEGSLAVLDSMDRGCVCETCIRNAAEVIGFKPELHSRQLREIRRLEIERDHWRDTTKRLRSELDQQIDANMAEPVRRNRKAAA